MSTSRTLDSAATTTAAIAAFLRGVERRAAVMAELLCGDPAQGDRGLVQAIERFSAAAPDKPEAEWPTLFWSTVLGDPTLSSEALAPYWPGDFAPLARLDVGPRGAILLRVVAGLDDIASAGVFGVDAADFRQALQGALPKRADGSLDGEAWLALNDEARRAMRDMPAERLAAIARAREAAVSSAQLDAPRKGFARPGWLSKLRVGLRA